jgi:hypothetical protein
VSVDGLEIGPAVGAGSQGSIHHVTGDLSAYPFPLICKRFASGTRVAGAALEQLARWRAGLATPERSMLDAHTVWPVAMVTEGERVVGYLMQEIPLRFLQLIETTGGTERIPREVQHLFVTDAMAERNLGEAPAPAERLVLARSMAFVLGFLHGKDFVYGDLSYKNAVYTLRPSPQVMLLDCDSIRQEGSQAAVAQLNSPGWAAPEGGPQTKLTDRYKLGLFVLRCLTPGVNAQNRDPDAARGVLDGEGRNLLVAALGADPAARPSGRDWVAYFDRVLAETVAPQPRSTAPPRPSRASVPRQAPVSTRPAQVRHRGGVALRPVASPVMTAAPLSGAPVRAGGPASAGGPPAGGLWSTLIAPRTSNPWLSSYTSGVGSLALSRLVGGFVALLVFGAVFFYVSSTAQSRFAATDSRLRLTSTTIGQPGLAATLPTTTLVPAGPDGPVQLASGLGVATDRARATVGPTPRLVAVSTAGTLGAVTPPAAAATLAAPAPQWVFQYFVDDPNAAPRGTATVRTVTVAGDQVVGDTTAAIPLAGGRRLVTMPGTFPTGLDRAARRVTTTARLGEPLRVSWVCDPAPGEPDCRWLFRFGLGADATAVFTSPDGDRTTPRPSWFTDALG